MGGRQESWPGGIRTSASNNRGIRVHAEILSDVRDRAHWLMKPIQWDLASGLRRACGAHGEQPTASTLEELIDTLLLTACQLDLQHAQRLRTYYGRLRRLNVWVHSESAETASQDELRRFVDLTSKLRSGIALMLHGLVSQAP